ncbi:pyruvate dehydrogenase, partial [Frankia sp. AgB1.8]|nr:pyruvate dehydrogenase [Frankia sp. AgB1.8]
GWGGGGGGGAGGGAGGAGGARAGRGGPAGPDRAARMFEAAGWQVLTLRHGRRLAALFGRPGGQALRGRLSRMGQEEYRELLATHGLALRRRLAGPGTAGVGIAGLVDTLTDDEIHAALRDLGGHDLALLIDAFDEVAQDRPTVLFAHVHDQATRDPVAHEVRQGPAPAVGITSIRPMGQGTAGAGPVVTPVAGGSALQPLAGGRSGQGGRGARLAAHVASYLDRAARAAPLPPPVPTDLETGGDGRALSSTQSAFGDLLRGLAGAAPEAVDAIVTVSTRDADGIVAGWLEPGADAGAALASPAGRRHVAGALAPGAFAGVLGNLGVAWNRQGLPLLPIGVTDELAAGRVVAAWAAGCATDARSVLAVTDTGRYAAGGGGQRLTGPGGPGGGPGGRGAPGGP